MINNNISCYLTLTFWVRALRGELHSFCGTWLRCNSLEWNDHSASLRLALHPKNRTLHPVQLPDLGLSQDMVARNSFSCTACRARRILTQFDRTPFHRQTIEQQQTAIQRFADIQQDF